MQQRLLYISRIAPGLTDLDVHRIVASSRIRNRRLDITGVLAMGQRLFAQVLEGDAGALQVLMGSIGGDGRHDDVRVLLDHTTDQRLFQRWNMELLLSRVLDDALDAAYDGGGNADALMSRLLAQANDDSL